MTTLTHTEQYEEGDDDSSGSVEGAIARSMFRTETDDEEDDTDNVNSCSPPLSTAMFVERHVMDICLCERQMGSSIAERLWPAAQYLAQFVMDVQDGSAWQQKEMSDYDNCDTRAAVQQLLESGNSLRIIELGAGVGLTGIQLATRFDTQVLITDLPEAMPLLKRNIQLNRKKFRAGPDAVQARVLAWGNEDHASQVVQEWQSPDCPVLVLASDCVYYAELHLPLEQTLATLLSNAPKGSVCLIAGARRWKRDTKFYAKLGKATRSATHCLSTTVLKETFTRNDQQGRQIMRLYCVQWLPRSDR